MRHNIDAMLVAETRGIPTILGHASFLPTGFAALFYAPDQWRHAEERLDGMAREAGLFRGFCTLDSRTGVWRAQTVTDALLRAGDHVGFGIGGSAREIIGIGWDDAEPKGRWSVGPVATLIFRLPPGRAYRLDFNGGVGFGAPNHPSGVTIAVNEQTVAHWSAGARTPNLRVPVPADLIAADGGVRVKLLIGSPIAPVSVGMGADARLLGVVIGGMDVVAADDAPKYRPQERRP